MSGDAVNADLARERERASVDVDALSTVLAGGATAQRQHHKIRSIVENDPHLGNASDIFMTRTERHVRSLVKAERLKELRSCHGWTEDEFYLARRVSGEVMPDDVHFSMFVPHCRAMLSAEQLEHWMPRIHSGEVVGCYAQTELAHGSNVRGLQTTATFIPETDEIEVHTPTLDAAKWWPGGLGHTANHALVFARLISRGKDCGLQSFIVPIRDAKHRPLPGVTTGDIGPKIGYNTMDNGMARFDRVRVPRTNMPMRFVELSRDGQLTRSPEANPRVSYVTMLGVRAMLVGSAGPILGRACVVAVRYSAVRRQGFNSEGSQKEEYQVLDYAMQQYRLLPLLATSYVLNWTGMVMNESIAKLQAELAEGDTSALPGLHGTSSGLKAITTRLVSDGIEECRKACGGHGYLLSSGLPEFELSYLANCTLEGDNYLIGQQTTRFLFKMLDQARRGEAVDPTCTYLEDAVGASRAVCSARRPEDFLNAEMQLEAYRQRSAHVLLRAENTIAAGRKKGLSADAALNGAMVEVGRASYAHCMLMVVHNCSHPLIQRLIDATPSGARGAADPRIVLKQLADLFALYWWEQDLGDFLEGGYMNAVQANLLRQQARADPRLPYTEGAHTSPIWQVRSLLAALRPEAVALVDAWDYSDYELNSALGRYDGRVYEALMASAEREPLNKNAPRTGGWKGVARRQGGVAATQGLEVSAKATPRGLASKL